MKLAFIFFLQIAVFFLGYYTNQCKNEYRNCLYCASFIQTTYYRDTVSLLFKPRTIVRNKEVQIVYNRRISITIAESDPTTNFFQA